jgi:adenine-specific DNA-methyltransferase
MAKKKTARKKAKTKTPVQIDSVRHNDKRKNIPTEELRDFVREEDEQAPPVLYPRDPSLDPQLVWKGKDEQDAEPLSVPTVPIYIQEKIHPHHIIEDFRASLPKEKGTGERQLELFSDFNGLPDEFEHRVDFYQHEGNWSNRMILGDSLLVMNSLAEKEGLRGQVQMIYIDPPYGIKFASN